MQDKMTIAQYGKQYNCETLLGRVLNNHDIPMIFEAVKQVNDEVIPHIYHVINIHEILGDGTQVIQLRRCYVGSPILIDVITARYLIQYRYECDAQYPSTHFDDLIKYICHYNYRYHFIGGQNLIDLASDMPALSDGSVIDLGLLAYK